MIGDYTTGKSLALKEEEKIPIFSIILDNTFCLLYFLSGQIRDTTRILCRLSKLNYVK